MGNILYNLELILVFVFLHCRPTSKKSWGKSGRTTAKELIRAPGSWSRSIDTISRPRKRRRGRAASHSNGLLAGDSSSPPRSFGAGLCWWDTRVPLVKVKFHWNTFFGFHSSEDIELHQKHWKPFFYLHSSKLSLMNLTHLDLNKCHTTLRPDVCFFLFAGSHSRWSALFSLVFFGTQNENYLHSVQQKTVSSSFVYFNVVNQTGLTVLVFDQFSDFTVN